MLVYRFCTKRRANDLSGTGAKIAGGRWNPKGFSVIYTSENRSLALAEYWAHVSKQVNGPSKVCTVEIEVPRSAPMAFVNLSKLPTNWRAIPPPSQLQRTGESWIKGNQSLVLKVPSVIMPLEHNYILNPAHPDIAGVKILSIDDYVWDPRMKP